MMPRGWESNPRSGVALAMRHRLKWFIHLQADGMKRYKDTNKPAMVRFVQGANSP